jgi:hypothetical protein
VVWSSARGLFSAPLRRGASAARIGERCRGGLAALAHAPAAHVACLQLPDDPVQPGRLTLWSRATRGATNTRDLASLGRDARDVALAAGREALYVTYGDGELGGPRVQLITLAEQGAGEATSQALSAPEQNGREPALIVHAGRPLIVFAASELGPKGAIHRLMLWRDGRARMLRELLNPSPRPTLAIDSDGLVLAFRDLPRPKARSELYVARLDPETGTLAGVRSIGRANGEGGPSLALCQRTRAAIVPIDHAGELYIAFNPLGRGLETPEANHQYYENEHEFVANAASCVGGYPMAVISERSEPNRPAARLLAAEFRCSD